MLRIGTALVRFSQPILRRGATASATSMKSRVRGNACSNSMSLARRFRYFSGTADTGPTTSNTMKSTPSSSSTDASAEDSTVKKEAIDSEDTIISKSSFTEEENGGDNARTLILSAALDLVPEHGWSETALQVAVESLDIHDYNQEEMFPCGPGDLVHYFEKTSNNKLTEYLEKQEGNSKQIIHSAIEFRLRMLVPYMEQWPQAMALKALPSNANWSLESLALMVDDMWYWAGDRSTDINWYSKRAFLAGIYSTTELFMIQDKSEDFKDTWDFLDNRLRDAQLLGKAARQMEGVMKGTMELVNSGVATASSLACGFKNKTW